MKKILAALAIAALASTASATITNSKHDLSLTSKYPNAKLGSCAYCHAPHLWNGTNVKVTTASGSTGAPPLWNRNIKTGTTYTIWGTTYIVVQAPGTRTLTCLSCHDGQLDLGAVNNGVGGVLGTIPAAANVGTDLTNDHPVGALYDPTDTQLVQTYDTSHGTYVGGAPGVGAKLNKDSGGKYWVECNSCHDPHDNTNGFFLRTVANNLCSACHLK